MDVILVALRGPSSARCLLEAAEAVADNLGPTHIEVLVVRLSPIATIMPTEEVLTDEQSDAWRAHEAARSAEIEAIYRSWAQSAAAKGHRCDWIDVEGVPAREVARRGQRAELVVIERPTRHMDDNGRMVVHAALFDTHRPVLIVPPEFRGRIGANVAIAWRDDGCAIKAVIPALRYFPKADRISALIGFRGQKPADGVPEPLAERGIQPDLHAMEIGPAPLGELLLAKAKELGADVLVAGAYTHSPLREMILGGVTRHVLSHATIPLLIRH